MWICKDCNAEFSTPDAAANIFDEINNICPRCGSREIKEISRCRICGQVTDKLTDDYCRDHITAAGDQMTLFAAAQGIKIDIARDLMLAFMEG